MCIICVTLTSDLVSVQHLRICILLYDSNTYCSLEFKKKKKNLFYKHQSSKLWFEWSNGILNEFI